MIVLVMISFFLDAVVFSSFHQDTLLCPLFSLLSLLIIYPILYQESKKYFIVCGVLGAFYDICYANTLFLHVFLFIGVGLLLHILFQKLSINVLNTYIVGILLIVSYRIFHALFFILFGFSKWNWELFMQSIISSIILNSIYLVSFYFLAKKIRLDLRNRKYKLLKVKKVE